MAEKTFIWYDEVLPVTPEMYEKMKEYFDRKDEKKEEEDGD